SSFEIGLLASYLNWVWAVAGRTLVRGLALASQRLDLTASSYLAMDIKALIAAMESNRSAVGAVTASVLQRLLADPFQVLPDSPPASSRNMKNFSSKHHAHLVSTSTSTEAPDLRLGTGSHATFCGPGHGSKGDENLTAIHMRPAALGVPNDPSGEGAAVHEPSTSAAAAAAVYEPGFPGHIFELPQESSPDGAARSGGSGAPGDFVMVQELEELAQTVMSEAAGMGGKW
ncbi:hypothetical protein JCM10207_004760, partial [Rhodosporidiobolus poonsookiae]